MSGGKDADAATSTDKRGDPNSPYYLHPSDNPGQLYVGDVLTEGNYAEWASDMINALYAKNKVGFVDGSLSMPTVDSPNLHHWMRCDAMVKGWLKTAMHRDIRSSVRYAKTASEVWTDLAERFGKGSAPRAYEVRREVATLRKDKLSVPTYYTKLKGLWDEIQTITPWPKCDCGTCKCNVAKQLTDMREREQLYDFLMGLDESFNTIKT